MSESNKKICPVQKKCGGCKLLPIPYSEQLQKKQKRVSSLLSKYGRVEKIIGMDNPYYYRNKVHAAFDHDRKGNAISGIYEEGSHRVINIDSCYLENQKADDIIVTIRSLLKSFKLKTYDEDTGYGFLRHVLIRTAHSTGQIMVVLVTGTPIFPSKNNFIKVLRSKHPEITTIVQNINDKRTSMILGERQQVLYGRGYIEDILCGKKFRISPKSFYQVNSVQTEILYNKAVEFADLNESEEVIDAYCGIGTISLVVAEHVKSVIGVELNDDAVKDAIINKKQNSVGNVKFINADAGKFMSGLAEEGNRCNVVFMDPPRSGSTVEFMDSVVSMKPDKVVYISCEPETLARDLGYFTKHGYKMDRAVLVDMFPMTENVECVVLLSKLHTK
ncbi:MAG: 23S rRNA (uracil(1939)-C(5))-methyltransferase RlmD [Lachnospiraceae bacterium]|nr:23S rRNA (uracil(1939)-C(5))-methyltransferase RlmD [Lachnospiraceae bacterium]